MMQTLAIFLDAYRELNSRKLFWFTLILSGLVVAIFGLIGINEQGLRIIIWDISSPLNSKLIPESLFYKLMFLNLGIKFWLGWVGTILALVSTAGIFPDLVTSGSVDLVLSKPISRTRLFLTKYIAGLLFVTLQVTVFSVASFLVLGFMGGTWEPAVFLAIPILVIFFSYLFSICAFLGIWTRSTITSLLLTLLFWFLIFMLHSTESTILTIDLMAQQDIDRLQVSVDRLEEQLEQRKKIEQDPDDTTTQRFEERLQEQSAELASSINSQNNLRIAHNVSIGIKTALPKTTETIGLLERWLIDLAELPKPDGGSNQGSVSFGNMNVDQERLQMDAQEAIRERSVFWVMGTSVIFEMVFLGLGAWRFSRRDF